MLSPPVTYRLELHDATGAYASCYWSDAFTRAEATHIVLGADTVFTADAELSPAGHIAGVVTDPDGVPLEGIYLHAGHIRDMDGQASTGVTAVDGSYDLGGLLPADDWVLFLEDVENEDYIFQFWDGASVYEDATPVAVTSGQTTTVDVRMQKSATISGVVTTRLGLPCYRVAVQAFARTALGGWVDVLRVLRHGGEVQDPSAAARPLQPGLLGHREVRRERGATIPTPRCAPRLGAAGS